jgi:hypothetical protein
MQTLKIAGRLIAVEPKFVAAPVRRPALRSMDWQESGGAYQEEAWFQDISVPEQELFF